MNRHIALSLIYLAVSVGFIIVAILPQFDGHVAVYSIATLGASIGFGISGRDLE